MLSWSGVLGIGDGEARLHIDGTTELSCFCGGGDGSGHSYGDGEHGIWAATAVQLEDTDAMLENCEGSLPASARPVLLWSSHELQPCLHVQ